MKEQQIKHAIITGSSRGIGYGLAVEFLKKGWCVTISGRNRDSLSETFKQLTKQFDAEKVFYQTCDVSSYLNIENLWDAAFENFGKVDIWINNAGIGQENKFLHEIDREKIKNIIDINIKGVFYGSRIAVEKMRDQGFGAIYNMEGFGSDGRKMKKMGLYGSTKVALRYFTRTLAMESENSEIIIGTISPGMVITDLLMKPIDEDSHDRKQFEKIVNILADKVETVTPFLVQKMIKNKKNGKAINWLTNGKILKRFLTYPFTKRKIIQ